MTRINSWCTWHLLTVEGGFSVKWSLGNVLHDGEQTVSDIQLLILGLSLSLKFLIFQSGSAATDQVQVWLLNPAPSSASPGGPRCLARIRGLCNTLKHETEVEGAEVAKARRCCSRLDVSGCRTRRYVLSQRCGLRFAAAPPTTRDTSGSGGSSPSDRQALKESDLNGPWMAEV